MPPQEPNINPPEPAVEDQVNAGQVFTPQVQIDDTAEDINQPQSELSDSSQLQDIPSADSATEDQQPIVQDTVPLDSEVPQVAEQPPVFEQPEIIPETTEPLVDQTDQTSPEVPATEDLQGQSFSDEQQPASEPVDQTSVERVSLTDLTSFAPSATATAVATPLEDLPVDKENIYTEICSQIIKEQEQIIGALAIEQAQQVEGLTIDPVTYHCVVNGDGSKVIDELIEQYRDFFGHAAVEVCKEAASRFLTRLPAEEFPVSLR